MVIREFLLRTTILDRLIILSLAGSAILMLVYLGGREPGGEVIAERNGDVIFKAPLDVDRTVRLEGPEGPTTLRIRSGKVCVTDSPCPLKVCMGMGEVARRGELLACVPNHLLIRISGGAEKEKPYDLLSR